MSGWLSGSGLPPPNSWPALSRPRVGGVRRRGGRRTRPDPRVLPTLLALSENSRSCRGSTREYPSFRRQTMIRRPISGPTHVFGTAELSRPGGPPRRLRRVARRGDDLLRRPPLASLPDRRDPGGRCLPRCAGRRTRRCPVSRARGDRRRQWAAGEAPPSTSTELLRLATWQASREGSAANCSTRMPPGRGRPARLSTNWSITSARPCAPPVMSGSLPRGSRRVFTRHRCSPAARRHGEDRAAWGRGCGPGAGHRWTGVSRGASSSSLAGLVVLCGTSAPRARNLSLNGGQTGDKCRRPGPLDRPEGSCTPASRSQECLYRSFVVVRT